MRTLVIGGAEIRNSGYYTDKMENHFKKEEVIKMEEVNQQCLKLQKRHLRSTIKPAMDLTSRMSLLPKVLVGIERIMASYMGFGV